MLGKAWKHARRTDETQAKGFLQDRGVSGGVHQRPPTCRRSNKANRDPEHHQKGNADPGPSCGDVHELLCLVLGQRQPGHNPWRIIRLFVWLLQSWWESLGSSTTCFSHAVPRRLKPRLRTSDRSRLSVRQESMQGNPGLKALQHQFAPSAPTHPSVQDRQTTAVPPQGRCCRGDQAQGLR